MRSQISVRTPNLKFQENSSGCSMWTDGRTDVAKVTVAFAIVLRTHL